MRDAHNYNTDDAYNPPETRRTSTDIPEACQAVSAPEARQADTDASGARQTGADASEEHQTNLAKKTDVFRGRGSKIPGYLILLGAAVISAVIALDQLSKFLVRSNMALGEALPSQDAFFSLRYALNDGIAFSLFQGYRVGLITVQSILVVGIIIVMIYVLRRFPSRLAVVVFSLMLGGGIGNLIDRIATGKVTDFLSVGTFPIFNIADTCLTVGCGLMLVCLFFFEKGIFENHGRAETDKTP